MEVDNLILHLKITGVILILLSLIHFIFPRYFNWKKELSQLSLMNRQMMKVHTFFIALVVFMIGLLCLLSADELIATKLGKTVSFGLAIFWTTRLIFQFFVYSSKLWKGKKLETIIHILFTGFWIYFSAVFWLSFIYAN